MHKTNPIDSAAAVTMKKKSQNHFIPKSTVNLFKISSLHKCNLCFFGFFSSNVCLCGNDTIKINASSDVHCQLRCVGNLSQCCGDIQHLQLYRTCECLCFILFHLIYNSFIRHKHSLLTFLLSVNISIFQHSLYNSGCNKNQIISISLLVSI